MFSNFQILISTIFRYIFHVFVFSKRNINFLLLYDVITNVQCIALGYKRVSSILFSVFHFSWINNFDDGKSNFNAWKLGKYCTFVLLANNLVKLSFLSTFQRNTWIGKRFVTFLDFIYNEGCFDIENLKTISTGESAIVARLCSFSFNLFK